MSNQALRVFVIEDDEDTRLNLRDILELDDHAVETASTGANALASPHLRETDVILLDRRLPDGYADVLLPKLQRAAPEAEVIIVTGHADMDSAVSALRQGACDYLLKPINPDALRASLRRLAERRRLSQRLVESERLAAIGEAMTGLTHESRNALARSQANLRRLARRLKDRPDLLELIDAALVAQEDVQRLFEDVRQYAAPLRLNPEVSNVRDLLFDAWEILAPERKNRRAELCERLCNVDLQCKVDPFPLRNAFRNILENALAACEDPVRIEVEFESAWIAGHAALQIAIRDNGPGFPQESAERAFDAFYTTKTHGTGLGLAIVRRTVEEHGGHVAIGSISGRGAEVVVTLPR